MKILKQHNENQQQQQQQRICVLFSFVYIGYIRHQQKHTCTLGYQHRQAQT